MKGTERGQHGGKVRGESMAQKGIQEHLSGDNGRARRKGGFGSGGIEHDPGRGATTLAFGRKHSLIERSEESNNTTWYYKKGIIGKRGEASTMLMGVREKSYRGQRCGSGKEITLAN